MRTGNLIRHFGKNVFMPLAMVAIFTLTVQAQGTMSLQECIEYAKDNSLSLKQSQYGIAMAKLTDEQNRQARYPNVNGSTSLGMQFGRTIDPTTNTFDNQRISFNSFGVNLGMTLYSGGRINNTIKQGETDIKASEADAAAAFNNLALNIANTYLQILMSEEQLASARDRRDLSTRQLEQTDKLIDAGVLPANDRLDVLAQVARDEQTIIMSQNSIDINYLLLKNFMQLDPSADLTIEKPTVVIPADANPDAITFGETYANALGSQPQVKAEEFRLQSAETDVAIARSALLPTLSLFGGIDTRWSSASKVVVSSIPTIQNQTVFIDNTPVTVGFESQEFTFGNNPYFDQLDQNFGQNVGLNLSVPIYNNGRNKINVQRSEVGILSARLQSDLVKQQLKSDVQTALANARAARLSYAASQKTVEAAQVAYDNADKRFRLGAINNLQLTTARNTLDIAENDLILTKYDYLFKLKIIDFYLGKELKLD